MLRALLTSTTLSLLVSRALAAIGPVADLVIANADVSPDGFTRTAALAGGTVSGVIITGNKGDNFQINVVNSLNDSRILQSTAIHWHGMFMAGTNWADGPAFVSQCPIAKGNSFLYDFTALDQAGTYWYHSHLSTQYCDGIRGPLIIYDPDDPHASLYDVDNGVRLEFRKSPNTCVPYASSYIPSRTADAILINGLGRWASDPTSELAVINVQFGVRYRFRLVSMSCDPNFLFSIQGHTLNVIEADGVSIVPRETDQIQIFAGQRYSFVLTADQEIANYWIRAIPNLPAPPANPVENGINSAILRYVTADVAEPLDDSIDIRNPLDENALVPLENPGAPTGTIFPVNLQFGFNPANLQFTVNGAPFIPPDVPVLLQLLSGAQTPDTLMPGGSIIRLPANAVVELSMPSGGLAGSPHPFHLHGHVFDVIRGPGQPANTEPNLTNPPRRDTVSIGNAGDNVTVRFVTDNPGPWFLHCHIDWHLELGLAVVFAEDTDRWVSNIDPSPAWDELCPIYSALPPGDL
uniref:Putative laccase 7 n=1 Tax=Flammulina velutipes TaxID=38945 RepID=V9XN99_FLAVE|nr:putative laccase 7 [Flammulina velutipes]